MVAFTELEAETEKKNFFIRNPNFLAVFKVDWDTCLL